MCVFVYLLIVNTILDVFRLQNSKKSRILAEVYRTPLIFVIRQDQTVRSNSNRTMSMHLMALAIPTRYSESNDRRNVKPENHLAPAQVRHELLPPLDIHHQGGATQLSCDCRRIFRFLIKRKQEWNSTYTLVLIIHRQLHGIIVNTDILICITCRDIVNYLGIFESTLLGQCRDGEFLDVESGPMGAQTEPQNESDDAHNEEKGQKYSTNELGYSSGEAFFHAVGVVMGRVLPLHGPVFFGGFNRNMGLRPHFSLISPGG